MDINLSVFTTKYIVLDLKPILYIFHGFDDEWQFLGGQSSSVSDLMIVSIKEILNTDATLLAIVKIIPIGYYASRVGIEGRWIVNPLEKE